jgi:hypothetical protein
MLDLGDLAQSGDALGDVIVALQSGAARRRELQPFLEPMSALLLDLLALNEPPNDLPVQNIADSYPRGVAQPGWAALLRQGRYVIAGDGHNQAVVFVPGDEAKSAYESAYPVIRHGLAGLLPADGTKLKVRVFAFKNDYASCALQLNMEPFLFNVDEFPPPHMKRPLNLHELAQELPTINVVGGRIGNGGFTIIGQKQTTGMETKRPATLADLAVAYRAVFHAGDDQAFISLDPHHDPTKAKVNFGGLLEDTWIGSVVFEADKRFKTITTGLDPNSGQDIRVALRNAVWNFATVAERDLASPERGKHGWIGTRFWYYPDSVELETDIDGRTVAIRTARFVADAERSRDDYTSPTDFERRKKTDLSPSIRENIDSLNNDYERLASVLQPLQDLETVARLMGLCCWLRKAPVDDFDLDALLSVELPNVRTPDYTAQFIAATAVLNLKNGTIAADLAHAVDAIAKNTSVIYLTPILDRKVDEYFVSPENLAQFLAASKGRLGSSFEFLQSASLMFDTTRSGSVREIIRSKRDLEALAEYAARRLDLPNPIEREELSAQIDTERSAIEGLERQLDEIRIRMRQSADAHNALVETYNSVVANYKMRTSRHNELVERFNRQDYVIDSVVEIGGGIELSPNSFKIRRVPDSTLVRQIIQFADGGRQVASSDHGPWTRLVCVGTKDVPTSRLRLESFATVSRIESGSSLAIHNQSRSNHRWLNWDRDSGGWRDQEVQRDGTTVSRYFDPSADELHVARFKNGQQTCNRIAQRDGPDRVRFRPGKSQILQPEEPPAWWVRNADSTQQSKTSP